MNSRNVDVAIIGAGLAGLAAGATLTSAGWSVEIMDKGRGVGGRMATRRFDGAVFDTGAQFFSARSDSFVTLLEETLIPGEAAKEWYRRGGGTYYRGSPSMTAPAKLLAEQLTVTTGCRVTAALPEEAGWRIRYERSESQGELFARALLLTPPVPQILDLLEGQADRLRSDRLELLSRLRYRPTIALLIRLNGLSPLEPPGYDRPGGDPVLYWVADNRQKGVSPPEAGPALTIHGRPDFSEAMYDSPEEEVIEAIMARFFEQYPERGRYEVAATQLKKWRYARPIHPAPERTYLINRPEIAPAAVAGDAFGGARVEGAYLSGIAAAELLEAELSR